VHTRTRHRRDFSGGTGRDETRDSGTGRQDRGSDGAGSTANRPIERQLADHHHLVGPGDLSAGGEYAEGDRKIEVGPGLGKMRWRQIHRDRSVGKTHP
jgi:hypothetical protein